MFMIGIVSSDPRLIGTTSDPGKALMVARNVHALGHTILAGDGVVVASIVDGHPHAAEELGKMRDLGNFLGHEVHFKRQWTGTMWSEQWSSAKFSLCKKTFEQWATGAKVEEKPAA